MRVGATMSRSATSVVCRLQLGVEAERRGDPGLRAGRWLGQRGRRRPAGARAGQRRVVEPADLRGGNCPTQGRPTRAGPARRPPGTASQTEPEGLTSGAHRRADARSEGADRSGANYAAAPHHRVPGAQHPVRPPTLQRGTGTRPSGSTPGRDGSPRHYVTDEAVYGRLLDRLGYSGLRDARRGLATLRHPGGNETTLWRPALRGAFPHRTVLSRGQAYKPLNDLRKLRNRIAHHEPIFERSLFDDHQRILDVTGRTSPEARTWIERHSRVPLLLDAAHYAKDVRFCGPAVPASSPTRSPPGPPRSSTAAGPRRGPIDAHRSSAQDRPRPRAPGDRSRTRLSRGAIPGRRGSSCRLHQPNEFAPDSEPGSDPSGSSSTRTSSAVRAT